MDYWRAKGWEWKFTWCGVGSRDVPVEGMLIMRWVGHAMALLGGVLCTGDADGADDYFHQGYLLGKVQSMPPAQIYYTQLKNNRNLSHDISKGHHEAEMYETFPEAQALAFKARGTFNGLFAKGIALHTRNAFQVLSETLDNPRWVTVFWAQPVGKKSQVKGGTNTAVQLSIMYGIKRVNLYNLDEREKFVGWLMQQLAKQNIPIPTT